MELFCLEYLTGATRLLEMQKQFLLSLSNLSSCQEPPVHLSIKEHLKLQTFQIKSFFLVGQYSPQEHRSNQIFLSTKKFGLSYGL